MTSDTDTDTDSNSVTLLFTDLNWSTQQTVTVLAAEDDDSEPGTALFTHTVTGPGTAYDGFSAPGVTATEIDNDPPGVIVSEARVSVPEDGSASYTMVLKTTPTADVKIKVARVFGDEDVTVTSDTDTDADSNSVTLLFTDLNWSMQQTVTILAAEDDDGAAGIAEFGHNVISSGTVYHHIPAPGVTATEIDNDTIGVIISPTALSVPEGGSATYTVRLGTKPLNEDVTVEATRDQLSDTDLTVTSDTDTDTDSNSVTLLFTDLNWHTEQTVTVSAAEDDADEVDGVAIFSHGTAGDDDYYDIYNDLVTATEADNEKVVTVAIQTDVSAPVRGVFEVMIIFSEAVTGFDQSKIAVTNGSVTDFSGSGTTYKAWITPSKNGGVIVEVEANVVEYGVGNGNRAAKPLVIETDLDRPEVTIEGPTEPVGIAGFDVTIRFSESVEGFELEDVRVTNGTASNFTKVSPQEYTATITPEGRIGEVRVEVPEDVAEDVAGNGNPAAKPLVIEADLDRPEVTIEGPTEPVGIAGFDVTIRFSESVEGFELEDVRVTNGTASNFTKVSPQEYTATITPEGRIGEVRVEVPEDVAEDVAGNGNPAAKPLVIEADLDRPEVTIEGPTEPVGIAGFDVTIRFSESVEGFELEDVRVTNGTASNFTKVSPQEYTATITPEGRIGEVRVEVPEDVAEDVAGNGNPAAKPLVIEADLDRPEVTIEGPTEPVGIAGFDVTIRFSESVEGFELEDVRVTNGTASNFTKVSPQEYTATITPEGRIGEVRVEVPEDVAEDVAGNGNPAAEAFEVESKRVVSYQESYTAKEGGEMVAVTVKLSQGWDEELAIPIRVTRPEATEVADYTLDGLEDWDAQEGTGRLTFPAEETEQTFTIEANHDGDGDDETVELGFGELPEIVIAGEPAVATVVLEDKGLVELKVSFRQAEYEIGEGEQADIEVKVAPTADRRVEVPLVVAPKGGATDEDYSGVPAKVVFEEGRERGDDFRGGVGG